MSQREIDGPGAYSLGPLGHSSGEPHVRLGPAGDLDVLPSEGAGDSKAEGLADRFLAREASRVVLRRIGPRLAVVALGLGEAALAKGCVAAQGDGDALDLDHVEADFHAAPSSQPGRSAIESMTPSGWGSAFSSAADLNLPVRTSTARIPIRLAPPMSASMSSPTITASAGLAWR